MFSGNRLWAGGHRGQRGFHHASYLPGRSDAVSEGPETALLGEAFAQLEAYFAGRRKTFDLPLRFDEGTPFMKQVWQALCMVPYAHTASYKDIAEAMDVSLRTVEAHMYKALKFLRSRLEGYIRNK